LTPAQSRSTYAGLKEYGKALADYDEFLHANPKSAEGYFNQGLVYPRSAG
jgi:tetratricopeptide (TPR) repeat protein